MNIDRYISADDGVVRANSKALIEKIRSRPTSSPHYGLIHADIYQDNFRVLDTGELELFDFDNSEYGWFVSDLANALYAALWRVKDPVDRAGFPQRFLDRFLCGYERHYTLPSDELKLLPDFLRLRDVLIYTVGKKQLDPNRLTDIEIRMFGIRRFRIESQIPVFEPTL